MEAILVDWWLGISGGHWFWGGEFGGVGLRTFLWGDFKEEILFEAEGGFVEVFGFWWESFCRKGEFFFWFFGGRGWGGCFGPAGFFLRPTSLVLRGRILGGSFFFLGMVLIWEAPFAEVNLFWSGVDFFFWGGGVFIIYFFKWIMLYSLNMFNVY